MTMPGASIVEFMLSAILTALREASGTDQVTKQVGRLLTVVLESEQSAGTLLQALVLVHRPTFLYSCLQPALAAGFIARTLPDKPTSRLDP